MKANSCGTMDEQIRARMGFKSLKERKECGADLAKNCRSCKFIFNKTYSNRDGGCGVSVRCGLPGAGFTTRESAGCDKWERNL